jgi:uncharacterized membrane protein YgcG
VRVIGRASLSGLALGLLLLGASPCALAVERTERYDVEITIERSGAILVTETIVQDFGATPRHGIYRDVPERLRYDDTYDRVYPITVVEVRTSPGTPDDLHTEHVDGFLRIRIGDPDVTVTGRHTYEITYRVEGAMNRFETHDELYWNAIGDGWAQEIGQARVTVRAPAAITRVACFAGLSGSSSGCDRAQIVDGAATFVQRDLAAFNAFTIVVALPRGTVESAAPILEERWSLDRAFARTPLTVGVALGGTVVVLVAVGVVAWRRGRDRRYRGSPVDQVMGGAGLGEQAVPLFESGSAPVEFAPPEGLRPGQIGTFLDERADTLDVAATIVDLSVRRYLVIEEIERRGWVAKPDWKLTRRPGPDPDLLPYERRLLQALFRDGDEVRLSALRNRFADELREVREALYDEAVRRGWFAAHPERVREEWGAAGLSVLIIGIALTVALARSTHLALLGLPVVVGGIALALVSGSMPRRTAKGTALARRVAGFRRVIESAETHMARWAEEEGVFTRYLPYAIVFGCTERWAKAFADLATGEPDTSWYISSRPSALADLGERIDGFTVMTSGIIASTPGGSGSSGFGGGGSAGGGGGGGGGGSW